MNEKDHPVELLAPAGSYESMVAAVNAGADAVYIGGSKFGARAFADNPKEELLMKAIDFIHLHHKKLYLTVNTLFKEEELSDLYGYLKPFYEQGIDAVIVQDLGTLRYIRRTFPDLPVHASTQMTVTGSFGVEILKKYGVSRVVTARELSLEEIRKIHETTNIEIETFVHGALCYCYSGQCLHSSLIGGRSGNRGRCAQPCRLPYHILTNGRAQKDRNQQYLLNLKDLCALDLLPELIDAGVYSMKIEGRMKSPRYTAGVVSVYRKYIDQYLEFGVKGYEVAPEDKQMLLDVFDRGGFTEGYFKNHQEKRMVALCKKPNFREGNQKLFDYLDEKYVYGEKKEKIKGKVKISKDIPATIEIVHSGDFVKAEGGIPVQALNQPLTKEKLQKQIEKTGNTPFIFEELQVVLEDGLFMSMQAINELRRFGIQALERAKTSQYRRKSVPRQEVVHLEQPEGNVRPKLNVLIEQTSYLEEVLAILEVTVVEIDSCVFMASSWKKTVAACHAAGKECYLVLPHIFRRKALQYFAEHLTELKAAKFDGYVIKSLEELGFLQKNRIEGRKIADHNLYTFNQESIQCFKELGMDGTTAPIELNYRELRQRGCAVSELIVYGYLPMMVSAQCIKNTTAGCSKKPGSLLIKDRLGKEFQVKNQCIFCYNTIYNSSPLSLAGNRQEINHLKPESVRLQFTIEQKKEIQPIIRLFIDSLFYNHRTGDSPFPITRGHFKRGVE